MNEYCSECGKHVIRCTCIVRRLAITPGTVKRVHVDKHVIAANLKHDRNDAPITVQTSKGSLKCYGVDIKGPSRFVYQPNKPLSCGARLWIETHAEIDIL